MKAPIRVSRESNLHVAIIIGRSFRINIVNLFIYLFFFLKTFCTGRCFARPLNKGDHLNTGQFTVIKGNDFQDFGK